MKKFLLSAMLGFALLFAAGLFSGNVKAASDTDDPLSGRASGQIDEGFFDENNENGISLYSEEPGSTRSNVTVRKGIDVSKWQTDIDWDKVRDSGVEFVIVRVGYRGGETGALGEDARYKEHIEGALKAGLKVGVYFFSQAITEEEAVEEADFVLQRIYKYDIQLPVVIDYEYMANNTGRLYAADLTREEATDVVNAFCERVTQYGYAGMVYANRSMLTNDLDAEDISPKYRVWLANYQSPQMTDFEEEPTTSYTGKYDFFQFSSKGKVPGINGDVDLDYWYDDGTISGQDYGAVFDATYYANAYADVRAAFGNDVAGLLKHFIDCGMNEGRQGSSNFNVYSYKNLYPDLRRAFGNNLREYYMHFVTCGRLEGRVATGYENALVGAVTSLGKNDYSLVYDFNYYISHNPDVKNTFGFDDEAVLQHFVDCGMNEGRQGNKNFNVYSYKNLYPDLRQIFGNDIRSYYQHYIDCGHSENRIATGYENERVGAITSLGTRDYSGVYNYDYYISHNADVKNVFGDDDIAVLQHFVECGMHEGRQASENFNVQIYRNRYADLRAAFGNDLEKYYLHYLDNGISEGRSGI